MNIIHVNNLKPISMACSYSVIKDNDFDQTNVRFLSEFQQTDINCEFDLFASSFISTKALVAITN